jgi:uncharacterized protein YbjT (DUF2867 family)
MTVVVFGATGNVGAAALRALQARGVDARAFTRAAGDDLDDPASIARALDGADRVILSTPDGPEKVRREQAVIDASGHVERLVKLSGALPIPPYDWHGAIEDHLRASGIPHAVIRAQFFTTNLQVFDGVLAAPAGDAKVAMIDPRDVGEAAAAALFEDRPEYRLSGPEPITFAHAARTLGARYVDLPPEALAGTRPEWLARHLDGIFSLVRAGRFARVTDDLPALLRRPASPLRPRAA